MYGGRTSCRNWECFEAIVASLRELENEETLLVNQASQLAFSTLRLTRSLDCQF